MSLVWRMDLMNKGENGIMESEVPSARARARARAAGTARESSRILQ